jgi:hypothetical protein
MLTDEPVPRRPPSIWQPFVATGSTLEKLQRPTARGDRSFQDVLSARRSSIGNSVGLPLVGELLWHAAGLKGYAQAGRAGLPIGWSASPTSGGLQSICIVCISDDGSAPRLYEPSSHAFSVLATNSSAVHDENEVAVASVAGVRRGCTLRLIGDRSKLLAAYENVDSLLLRDAGAIVATICLCAEWLGLCACPLGFLGNALLPLIGFPTDRFQGVGAVQISSCASSDSET